MFSSTPTGFEGTPVTKRIVYFSLVFPIVISLQEVQYLFDLSITPHLTEWFQWWRIVINQLAYTSQSEVLMAVMLLYNMRVIERLFGSRKFLSFVVLIYGLTMVVLPVVLLAAQTFLPLSTPPNVSPGPTALVFALLVHYYHLIPVVYRVQFSPGPSSYEEFKLQFSDKTFVYLIALQLALRRWAVLPALTGWVLGELIYSELIPGRNWRVPFYKNMPDVE